MLAIETARIALRPFTAEDAPRVAALLENSNVARSTALVPHPYTLADAENWIGEKYWALGFATESLQGAVAIGFDGLNAEFPTAVALASNRGSCRVLEKSNFVQTGMSDMPHRDCGVQRFVHYRLECETWERARALTGKGSTR